MIYHFLFVSATLYTKVEQYAHVKIPGTWTIIFCILLPILLTNGFHNMWYWRVLIWVGVGYWLYQAKLMDDDKHAWVSELNEFVVIISFQQGIIYSISHCNKHQKPFFPLQRQNIMLTFPFLSMFSLKKSKSAVKISNSFIFISVPSNI